MKTLIKNGRFVTAVDDYKADILIEEEQITSKYDALETHARNSNAFSFNKYCNNYTESRLGFEALSIKPLQTLLVVIFMAIATMSLSGQEKKTNSILGLTGWRLPIKSDIKGYWKIETWDEECKQIELANKKRVNDAVEDFGTYQKNSDPKSGDEKMECWKPNFPVNVAKGDYNGDGIEDEARILISTAKSNLIGIFVFLGSKDEKAKIIKVETIEIVSDLSPIQDHFISTQKPSDEKILTACGKGYWDCKPTEPKAITLRRDAISFGEFEAWEAIAYWDSSSNKFKIVALSD